MLELIQYLHLQSSFYLWFSSRGSCAGALGSCAFLQRCGQNVMQVGTEMVKTFLLIGCKVIGTGGRHS